MHKYRKATSTENNMCIGSECSWWTAMDTRCMRLYFAYLETFGQIRLKMWKQISSSILLLTLRLLKLLESNF